ncbi:MAG: hypothetical protein E7015_02130 [Alphaproteobacteria bacterium]|nr:hypothetical protein [Alphaproteobacteria bacterium]
MIKRLMVVLYVVLCPIVHEANGMIFCSDEAIKENCEALSAILYGGDTSRLIQWRMPLKKQKA